MDMRTIASDASPASPLDLIEHLAGEDQWPFERLGEDELHVTARGQWCDYHLSFSHRTDLEALHVAVAFDLKAPVEKLAELYKLLALINEQLWVGHFDLWSEDRLVMFRHGTLLNGGAELTLEQCDAILRLSVEACERFYPAFQFVIWAGKGARDAMDACMFETEGQA